MKLQIAFCLSLAASQAVAATSGGEVSKAATPDKIGRFMVNFKIGPAIGAYNSAHLGAIVLEGGWAVLENKSLYLVVPLQFHFTSGGGSFHLPVGLQYDVTLPVKNLYVYPRLSMGYLLAFAGDGAGNTVTSHFGVITPEFGIKYVLNGRWNLGGEPVSLPIAFNSGGAALQYRILLTAGANF